MASKERSKLRFYTRHHALCHKIRKETGIEILPSDVERVMYIYTCAKCGEEQWSVEMKKGKLTRPVGELNCSVCGTVHKIKEAT